jgi:sterol desaturase/sphingolipid hydroxylase (fatty acid hydroxylase superfamily)
MRLHLTSLNDLSPFLKRAVEHLLEPLSSWDNFIFAISYGVRGFIDLHSKLAWLYLLSSIFIAWLLYVLGQKRELIPERTSFLNFIFPSAIYRHPSAKVDYKFVAIDSSIQLLLYMPFITGLSIVVYKGLVYFLTEVLSLAPLYTSGSEGTIITFLAVVLLGDLVFFVSHYLMHKVPFLWHFHKVHHSAAVLTPITVHRVHPVESLVNGIVAAIFSAVMASTYTVVSENHANLFTIWGVNIITFSFFLCAHQLRHSHIWLSFGPFLNVIFISPAQHQIHHSVDPKHLNKNFGYMLAIWDACIGSLYTPRCRETLRYGLPDGEDKEFSTVAKLYFLPFAKSVRGLFT